MVLQCVRTVDVLASLATFGITRTGSIGLVVFCSAFKLSPHTAVDAIKGASGRTCLYLSDTCGTGTRFLVISLRWGNLGLNVVTRGTLLFPHFSSSSGCGVLSLGGPPLPSQLVVGPGWCHIHTSLDAGVALGFSGNVPL